MKHYTRAHEVESILFAMYAALPLYVTTAVSPFSVLLYHLVMGSIAFRVWRRGRAIEVSVQFLGAAGLLYLLFFPVDVIAVSHSLIRSSAHLLFFIAVYQILESAWRDNVGQRILVTFLIFVTSVATSTHITVALFVVGFVWLVFRQLMHLSHQRTVLQTGVEYEEAPVGGSSLAYVIPTIAVASILFPVLPRLHSPFTGGLSAPLDRRSTGISETIDFSVSRRVSNDPEVVARVWMSPDAIPFFTPVRLRAAVYDEFWNGEWRGSRKQRNDIVELPMNNEGFVVARRQGFSQTLTVQEQPTAQMRLYLPVGTHAVSGLRWMFKRAKLYYAPELARGPVSFSAHVSKTVLPLRNERVDVVTGYPVSRPVADLAQSIAGDATTTTEIAGRIEHYLRNNFVYVSNVNQQGRPITLEQFLLHDRRGHCEYFAAGMVVLLTALQIPARIVGGFYGGQYNPLGGYFVLRRSDAHAWVEVFDGRKWVTYDPTPPDLRPGAGKEGLLLSYFDALGESISFFWDRWILTYGVLDQMHFASSAMDAAHASLKRIRGGVATTVAWLPRIFAVMGSVVILVLLVIAWRMWPGRRSPYEEALHRLERLGIEIGGSTTPEEVLGRVRETRPELLPLVMPIVDAYLVERFSPRSPGSAQREAASRGLTGLRLAESSR